MTGLGVFDSLATGAIGAALIAVAAALTLTPAALVLLGDRLDRFSLRRAVTAAQNGTFWRRLADFVVRRRVAVVAVIVPVMLVLSIPIAGMHITLKSISVLPSSDPVRVATADVAEHFGPGAGTPAVVVAHAPPARLRRLIAAQPGVVQRRPDRTRRARVGPHLRRRSTPTPTARARIRSSASCAHRWVGQYGSQAVVGGATAVGLDLIQRIDERTPWVVLVVLLAEILVLTVIFAAPLIALKAALTTLLSVTAALGVMTFLFRSTGDIGYFVPLFLFATIFGLSTDYEVFLLSRVREHHRRRRIQHRQPQARADRLLPLDHARRDHDGRRVLLLRRLPARPVPGARRGDGPCDRARRDGRARPARARDGGAARRAELVAAAVARADTSRERGERPRNTTPDDGSYLDLPETLA